MDDHHLSLTSPGPSGMHHLEYPMNMQFELDPQTLPDGLQGNMNFPHEAHAPEKYPICRWAAENGPWDPQHLTCGTEDGNGQSIVSDPRNNQFMIAGRTDVVPSEIMPRSDSGYGSYPNDSVCDDSFAAGPDAQSTIGGSIVDAQFPISDAMSRDSIALSNSWPEPIAVELSLRCETCGKSVRTKSELKKHDQRHKKPFKCDVQDCTRVTEGFSTLNDLERHKRSVHPDSQTSGNRYICQIGNCKNKQKIWPRADNFKAHLKRVHHQENLSDEHLERCIYRQPVMSHEPQGNLPQGAIAGLHGYRDWAIHGVPNNLGPLRSLGGAHAEENISISGNLPQELANTDIHHESPHQASEPEPTSPSSITLSSPMPHNHLSFEAKVPATPSSPVQEQIVQMPRAYSAETHVAEADTIVCSVLDESSKSALSNSSAHCLSDHLIKTDNGVSEASEPEESLVHGTGSFNLSLDSLHLGNGEIKKLLEVLDSRGILEQYGYKRKSAETDEQDQRHPCLHCTKTFQRKCELKKHEKRHEKPYECTMPDCDKKFGSKNDWKRHENTQHSMEMWKCDMESCEVVCYCEDKFRDHVEQHHRIADQNSLEAMLEKCRIGRNFETKFWCNFCNAIVEIKQKGRQGWAGRFDHIGEHFSSRKRGQKATGEGKEVNASRRNSKLPKDDSDDGEPCSPPLKNVKAQRPTRDGTRHSLSRSKPKRKRDDGSRAGSSKRSKTAAGQGLVCCQCGDLVTASQPRCCNFPCEHLPCDNCSRT